jgi:hypothetical protein
MTGLIKKAVLGGALAVSTLAAVAPAEAQYYRDRHHRGGDAAGAAIVGGIIGLGLGAAIASSSNRDRYYDRGYYNAPRGYYHNSYNSYYQPYYSNPYHYQRRCWTERRYDPYIGRRVRVRICQ